MIFKPSKIYGRKLVVFFFLLCFAGIVCSGCKTSETNAQQDSTTAISTQISVPVEETSLENDKLSNSNDASATNNVKKKKKKKQLTEKDYKKLIDFDAEHPFVIKVNRSKNFVCIYGLDKNGRYSVPYKIFRCSVGLYEGSTPLGCFFTSDKYEWRMMVDYSYAQYAIRISGPIMLHSVP